MFDVQRDLHCRMNWERQPSQASCPWQQTQTRLRRSSKCATAR